MTGPPQLSAAYDRARDEARAGLVVVDEEHDVHEAQPAPRRALAFSSFSELAAQVDAAGPRRFLIRGLWPAADYAVLAAEPKSGKSWSAADLAVSVATGTPWLGAFPVDQPGPVLWFTGEGSPGNVVRRVRAVARGRGIDHDDLDIAICTRAPKLNSDEHMGAMADQIEAQRPVLTVVDPLYLSLGGAARIGDLQQVGSLLERPQLVAQAHGSALLLVHHTTKPRADGGGEPRMTGAGPEEWGRLLLTAAVRQRSTDPTTSATTVVTHMRAWGGEVPDRTVKVTRRVWSDDPEDLDSPLHVVTEVGEPEPEPARSRAASRPAHSSAGASDPAALPPAAAKLLEALGDTEYPVTISRLVDRIADRHGHGLKRETASRMLSLLEKRGLAHGQSQGAFAEKLWRSGTTPDLFTSQSSPDPDPSRDHSRDVTRDGHTSRDSRDPRDRPLTGGGGAVTRSHVTREHAGHAVTRSRGVEPLPPEPEPEEDR